MNGRDLVHDVAEAIRQAYADDTAEGDATAVGNIVDWYGEAEAAIAVVSATGLPGKTDERTKQ